MWATSKNFRVNEQGPALLCKYWSHWSTNWLYAKTRQAGRFFCRSWNRDPECLGIWKKIFRPVGLRVKWHNIFITDQSFPLWKDRWPERHQILGVSPYFKYIHYLKISGTPVKISLFWKSTDLKDRLTDYMPKPDRPEDVFADPGRGTLNVREYEKQSSGLSG